MYYRDVLDICQHYFEMLLLASQSDYDEAPTSVSTVNAYESQRSGKYGRHDAVPDRAGGWKKDKKKPKRVPGKNRIIFPNAKMLLMERNHLSEEDAYRYIQKCSMDSGTNMVETAQMVLMLLYDYV